MDLSLILLLIGGLVVVSTAVGFLVKGLEGRVKKEDGLTRIDPRTLGEDISFGSIGTLLQFSSEFCTKCPGTRKYLAQVASAHPGVLHVDIDVTHRQDLTQQFNILQTPTTFILDESGAIAARIGGSPRPEAVTAGLEIAIKREHDSYVI
jgi:thiol-disulfide isomerase/thioredoxin